MPTTPRRRFRRPERRRIIEEAALGVFAAHGYAESRLEEIAAAAGVTKQLLYQHFQTKQALYLALLDKHRAQLMGQLIGDLGPSMSDPARGPDALDRWLVWIETHPQAAALLFRDTSGDPQIQAHYRQSQAAARAAITAGLESRNAVAADQLEPLAELIRAAGTGLALWWTEHPEVPRATIREILLSSIDVPTAANSGP